MRTLACLAAAGTFALFASGARGQTTAYAEAFDTLYSVDLTSHTAAPIGPAGNYGGQIIANLSGLSYSFDGTLYAVAGGINALARIDPSNGSATIVGSFGQHRPRDHRHRRAGTTAVRRRRPRRQHVLQDRYPDRRCDRGRQFRL
jgi:hypothetical protein